jgi:hypothetical protein
LRRLVEQIVTAQFAGVNHFRIHHRDHLVRRQARRP